MRHLLSSVLRLAAPSVAIASLIALAIPPQPAQARRNDYQVCAAALSESGLSRRAVATACAEALRPVDLATCVIDIDADTAVEAAAALDGCRRVRRPLEYSTCVVNIISTAEGAAAGEVLDNCRRSLLPARFSECVVGLRSAIDFRPVAAMNTCIASTNPSQDGLPNETTEELVPEVQDPAPDVVVPEELAPSNESSPLPTQPAPSPAAPTP
ncbi:MAG: hypothetical protein MUF49_00215 [Oculatellaceae cyanobacterium Prado106]|jgi:hypothetical protein|nr:hypothetical protein [Oculatellaceae cyanobacterium Prado106]